MAKRVRALSVMLDSGAYSAWFHGAPIRLEDYIAYCLEHRELFETIVALDKIPGANRSAAKSAADIEQAAQQSHDNYWKMRKAGLDPIPVFHQGEDWKWLERMLDEKITYIGISPFPRAGAPSIQRWLDEVFTRITDPQGCPIVRTHGFGATSWAMMTRYPWYSMDSTTWALAAGYATIIMPPFRSKQPASFIGHAELVADYDRPPLRFSISDRDTGGSRPLLKEHGLARRLIDEHLAKLDLTVSDIRSSDRYRAEVNAYYYVQLEASLGRKPFRHRRASEAARAPLVGFNYRPRVIFAEQMGKTDYARALARVGASKRLISYYECRRYAPADLKTYCNTGLLEKKNLAAKKPWSQSWIVARRIGLLARLKEADPNV